MTDFIVDFGRIGDCLGDFFAQQSAIPLPQSMNKPFHCGFRYGQGLGEGGIRDVFTLRAEA